MFFGNVSEIISEMLTVIVFGNVDGYVSEYIRRCYLGLSTINGKSRYFLELSNPRYFNRGGGWTRSQGTSLKGKIIYLF